MRQIFLFEFLNWLLSFVRFRTSSPRVRFDHTLEHRQFSKAFTFIWLLLRSKSDRQSMKHNNYWCAYMSWLSLIFFFRCIWPTWIKWIHTTRKIEEKKMRDSLKERDSLRLSYRWVHHLWCVSFMCYLNTCICWNPAKVSHSKMYDWKLSDDWAIIHSIFSFMIRIAIFIIKSFHFKHQRDVEDKFANTGNYFFEKISAMRLLGVSLVTRWMSVLDIKYSMVYFIDEKLDDGFR